MSQLLAIVQELLKRGEYLVSRHGYRELAADDILLDEVLVGISSAVVVEDYPDSRKEPSVLVLQRDRTGLPVHVMWCSEDERSSGSVGNGLSTRARALVARLHEAEEAIDANIKRVHP